MVVENLVDKLVDKKLNINIHRFLFTSIYIYFVLFGASNFTKSTFGLVYYCSSLIVLPYCFFHISKCYRFLNVCYVLAAVLVGFALYDPKVIELITSSIVFIVEFFFFIVGAIIAIYLGVGVVKSDDSDLIEKMRQEKKERREGENQKWWDEHYEKQRQERWDRGEL